MLLYEHLGPGHKFKGEAMNVLNPKHIFIATYIVLLSGCQTFTPYTTEENGGSYRQGEKPAYSISQITNTNGPSCAADANNLDASKHLVDKDCRVFGKLTQTNPSSNISFQTFIYDINGKPVHMVTCASPAEVAKAFTFQASGVLAVPVANSAVSANASGSQSDTVTVIQSPDSVTRYVAAAAYYNCLAYAGGMITKDEAAENLRKILDNAIKLAPNQNQNSSMQPKAK